MNIKAQKQAILKAMREIFPNILPSRLQEARQSVLTHMGMTHADFGFYPSGQSKFDNLCSQAVKDLKATGEMTTQGWDWRWTGSSESEGAPTMMMVGDDLFGDFEVVGSEPSLYDLNDEETLIRLVATTDCFGRVVQSDSMCQGCPLFDSCCEQKGEKALAKREAKEARNEALSQASEAGYDLTKVKVPKSARLHETTQIEALGETSCVVSGEPILTGEVVYHIPSWGMVKSVIGDAYKAIHNL